MGRWDWRWNRLRAAATQVFWDAPLLGPWAVGREIGIVPARPCRVLFLCKGNICRSAYAEYAAARFVSEAGKAEAPGAFAFSSAGLAAHPGTSSPERAVAVARERGIELGGHRSRQLQIEDLSRHDVVFVMEPAQRGNPLLSGTRAVLLGALRPGYPLAAIRDPYGRDEAAFTRAFDEIDAAIRGLLARATAMPGPGATPARRTR